MICCTRSLVGPTTRTWSRRDLHTETASEVGLGELVEVYVPLRFASSGPPEGAFEIYLSYRPIASAIASDKRTIALLVAIGLGAVVGDPVSHRRAGLAPAAPPSAGELSPGRYDQLTGLPNRTLFIERVAQAVRQEKRDDGAVAVLLIDLDRFTEVNNTLGSANGDGLLREVARRLRDELPERRLWPAWWR